MKFDAGNFLNSVYKFQVWLKSNKYPALPERLNIAGDTFAIQAISVNINSPKMTQNALLCFCCNSCYFNAPGCYVTIMSLKVLF